MEKMVKQKLKLKSY